MNIIQHLSSEYSPPPMHLNLRRFIHVPSENLRWFSIISGFFCLSSLAASGVDFFSGSRGIYTVKIPGKPADKAQARTYFGMQLLPNTRVAGVVGSVSGDAVTISGQFSYTAFNDPERKSYLHILAGNGRGFIVDIEEFGATHMRCAQDLSNWISPGVQVLVRPHSNLADVFGIGNICGLASGPDAGSADNVVAWDPVTRSERVYYFHSTRARWEEEDVVADASRAVLRFPYGLYVIRRSAGTLRIALSGEVGANPLLLPVGTGANVFSLPINLSASLGNLISSTGDFPVIRGSNSAQADLLTFEEPSTGNRLGPFYHSSRAGAEGWREVGFNESGAPIQRLDLLSTLILRRTGAEGYVRAEGSLVPGPVVPPIPPNAEPGELPLSGQIMIPPRFLQGDLAMTIQTSADLQTWTNAGVVFSQSGNLVTFPLPGGQTRAFYRVKGSTF